MRTILLAMLLASLPAQGQPNPAEPPPPPRVRALAFSPDGSRLASTLGLRDNARRFALWNVQTGETIAERTFEVPLGRCVFLDGKHLALAVDARLHLLDPANGKTLAEIEHPKKVRAVVAGPEGKFATTCDDGFVRIWDLATRKELLRTPEQRYAITQFAWSPDGKWLAGADEHNFYIWNARTGQREFASPEEWRYTATLAFTADGKTLVRVLGNDGTIQLVDVPNGAIRNRYTGMMGLVALRREPGAIDFVSTGYWGTEAKLHSRRLRFDGPTDAEQKQFDRLLIRLDADDLKDREEAGAGLVKMGNVIEPALAKAMKDAPSAEVRLRARLARNDILAAYTTLVPVEPLKPTGEAGISSLALSADGQTFALGGLDGQVRLFGRADGKTLRDFRFSAK